MLGEVRFVVVLGCSSCCGCSVVCCSGVVGSEEDGTRPSSASSEVRLVAGELFLDVVAGELFLEVDDESSNLGSDSSSFTWFIVHESIGFFG